MPQDQSPDVPNLQPLGSSELFQRRAESKEHLLDGNVKYDSDYDDLSQYSQTTDESQESVNNMFQSQVEIIPRYLINRNPAARDRYKNLFVYNIVL